MARQLLLVGLVVALLATALGYSGQPLPNFAHLEVPVFTGQSLSVAYIGPEEPAIFKREGSDEWTGYCVEIFDMVAKQLNVKLVPTAVSAQATSMHTSEWTACVQDVGLGNLDLCIGDFFMTPERWLMAPFLMPYDATLIVMWVPKLVEEQGRRRRLQLRAEERRLKGAAARSGGGGNRDEEAEMAEAERLQQMSWSEKTKTKLGKTFAPFTTGLWFTLVLLTLVTSTLYLFYERAHNEDDFPPGSSDFEQRVDTTYLGCLGLVSGGAAEAPATDEGKMLVLGFGFLVLITITAYTANLTATLSIPKEIASFKSVEQAVAQQVKFCVTSSLIPGLLEQFPGMVTVGSVGFDARYEAWENGDCDVILDRVEHSHFAVKSNYCDWEVVGDPVASMPISQPVGNRQFLHAFSYWLSTFRVDGTIFDIMEKYDETVAEHCEEKFEKEEAQVWGVADMLGAFAIWMTCACLSGCMHTHKTYCKPGGMLAHYKEKKLRLAAAKKEVEARDADELDDLMSQPGPGPLTNHDAAAVEMTAARSNGYPNPLGRSGPAPVDPAEMPLLAAEGMQILREVLGEVTELRRRMAQVEGSDSGPVASTGGAATATTAGDQDARPRLHNQRRV